ncbi:ribonuclease E inhibitor RraA/Dimethylmenaquinone methyltransferase [Umbelopsis sp. PMI_123]|nr:ribonuclease E inhibitor RraA/Dimethylmenaquinone methyltransferase [Umbelopsis sp. PMI_123]
MTALEQLQAFSTCEIADALQKLGNTPWGGYLADIQMWSPKFCSGETKIIGPAYTVKMVNKEDDNAPTPSQHFADAAPEGSVIFISAPPNYKNAVWGGLMSARAKTLNVQGVVVDGRIRDLAEHRGMQIPVFAQGHSILSQGAFLRPSEIGVPATMSTCPVVVHPGDIIVGDLDGVVCIPRDQIEQVVVYCQKYTAIDNRCMEDILQGASVQETFKKHRGV